MTQRRHPLHPILFAFGPALSLYGIAVMDIPLRDVLRPLALLAALGAITVLLMTRVARHREAAAVSASGLLVVLFLYGPLLDAALCRCPSAVALPLTTAAWLLMCAAALLLGRLCRPWPDAATRTANAFGLALLAIAVAPVAMHLFRSPEPSNTSATRAPTLDTATVSFERGTAQAQPDIYVLVVDGLARADLYRGLYGGDLSPFEGFLRGRGFRVIPRARANYAATLLVLSSLMNLDYLQSLLPGLQPRTKGILPLFRLLETSRVSALLRQSGYSITCYPGIYPPGHMPADRVLGEAPLSDFEMNLLHKTPWAAVPYAAAALPSLRPLLAADPSAMHRRQVLRELDTLGAQPPSDRPTFTFAHLMCPHPPFFFRADGGPGPQVAMTLGSGDDCPLKGPAYREAYVQQTTYVTSRLQQVVDRILARPGPEPVIIITADHGPGLTDRGPKHLTPAYLHERMSIFSAVRVPAGSHLNLPDDATPLVVLRAVLNECLHLDLPSLPNRSYFSPKIRPFQFTEYPAVDRRMRVWGASPREDSLDRRTAN